MHVGSANKENKTTTTIKTATKKVNTTVTGQIGKIMNVQKKMKYCKNYFPTFHLTSNFRSF